MRVEFKPADEEIRERRRRAYLERYPIGDQMEALTEAAMGRPEKLNELTQGLAEIRDALPFAKEE